MDATADPYPVVGGGPLSNLSTALLVLCVFVYLMQVGFALLEAGSVRSRHSTATLFKHILDTVIGCIAFVVIGYALTKGELPGQGNPFMCLQAKNLGVYNVESYIDVFYLMSFAGVSSTIMSGALSERAYHGPYGGFSAVTTGFLFPSVAYWVWAPGGWLFQLGFLDTAGVFQERFNDMGEVQALQGHSMPLMATGALFLWAGFFCFNSASVISSVITRDPADLRALNDLLGRCCVNVLVSTSTAFLTTYWLAHFSRKLILTRCLMGTITGGVAMCAGCMTFAPWSAAIVGFVSGGTYISVSYALEKVRLDDPMDAVPVHLAGGIVGTLSVIFFSQGNHPGIFYGSWRLLWVQPVGLIAVSAWTTAITLAYWLILRRFCRVRVPAEYEQQGLDVSFGMEPAYPEIYTMGDFVKFREFLETSWVASDARIAIDVFERRRSATALSHEYYRTDMREVMEQDRHAYHARRGSLGVESASSVPSSDFLAPHGGDGTRAGQASPANLSDTARPLGSDRPRKNSIISLLGGRRGSGSASASASPSFREEAAVELIGLSENLSRPRARLTPLVPAPPLPPSPDISPPRVSEDDPPMSVLKLDERGDEQG